MNQENILKRLSIIKLLFRMGISQSRQGEITSYFSILSFHDSVEMFLKLAVEVKDKKDCPNFMMYWERLPELTLKESMRNLNSNRVNLKHKGIFPANIDIESARVNTTDFFNQNTKIIFGIEFSEISLIGLIKYEKTKENLNHSNSYLEKNDFENSTKESIIAFNELLLEYKNSKSKQYYNSPFELTESVYFRNSGWGDDKTPIDSQLKELFEKVNDNFKNLNNAIEVISLGLNYKKYLKFKILSPKYYKQSSGAYAFYGENKVNLTKETCEFMFDFVIESALILQEFDFSYSELET